VKSDVGLVAPNSAIAGKVHFYQYKLVPCARLDFVVFEEG